MGRRGTNSDITFDSRRRGRREKRRGHWRCRRPNLAGRRSYLRLHCLRLHRRRGGVLRGRRGRSGCSCRSWCHRRIRSGHPRRQWSNHRGLSRAIRAQGLRLVRRSQSVKERWNRPLVISGRVCTEIPPLRLVEKSSPATTAWGLRILNNPLATIPLGAPLILGSPNTFRNPQGEVLLCSIRIRTRRRRVRRRPPHTNPVRMAYTCAACSRGRGAGGGTSYNSDLARGRALGRRPWWKPCVGAGLAGRRARHVLLRILRRVPSCRTQPTRHRRTLRRGNVNDTRRDRRLGRSSGRGARLRERHRRGRRSVLRRRSCGDGRWATGWCGRGKTHPALLVEDVPVRQFQRREGESDDSVLSTHRCDRESR